MTYIEKRLAEFDEQIEEMVKQTTYGLICEVCGGGGMFENLVCEKCQGHGLHTWRTNHLGEKIKAFLTTSITQAIAEERARVESALEDYFLSSYPIPDHKVISGSLREALSSLDKPDKEKHVCCDGECNHDDCCGKVEANCPLTDKDI